MEREADSVARPEFVYYICGDGLIKIGYTRNLYFRMVQLRPLGLMAVEPGGRSLEMRRHRQFIDDLASRGSEWFYPSRALHEHMAELANIYPVPDLDVLVDSYSTISGFCKMGHAIVGPNYQRSKGGTHVCRACSSAHIAAVKARAAGLPSDFATDASQRYERLMDGYDNPLEGAA